MRCLENYIGIEGCDAPTPESGLYINRLQGVSLKMIDKTANADQSTFLNVWRDVQSRGLNTFSTEVLNYFRTKYKLKKLVDQFEVGTIFNTNDTLPPVVGEDFRGVSVTLNPYNSVEPRVSSLISVGFTEIEFYSTTDVAGVRFIIANNVSGAVLEDITVDLVQGWNKIFTHFITPSSEFQRIVTVAVEVGTVTSINTSLDSGVGAGGCGCECTCTLGDCCEAKIQGFTFNDTTKEITENDENSFGFRGNVVLRCAYDGLVCANKDLFASALYYLLGAELMQERMYSDRVNKYTTIDKKKAVELYEVFDARYRHELSLVVDSIDLNDYGCCLECNPVVSYQYSRL